MLCTRACHRRGALRSWRRGNQLSTSVYFCPIRKLIFEFRCCYGNRCVETDFVENSFFFSVRMGFQASNFVVTSTLASQAPPAVGRALGIPLAHSLNGECPFPRDSLSYVSVGDGSVNNAHFLAATNLAQYAQHRRMKCPTLFCVTDNDLCISLRGGMFGCVRIPSSCKCHKGEKEK